METKQKLTKEEIINKVKEITADRLNRTTDEITLESSFKDLGSDSLDLVELSMEFEKEFNIHILDEDMEKIETVGGAIKCIETELNK